MQPGFVRNIQFTKLIKVDGRLREFNFRKPNGKAEGLFTVDTIDDRANRIVFNMEKTGDHWTVITPGLPVWVSNLENNFDSIIDEELSHN